MHGGFLLGVAVIVIYAAAAMFDPPRRRKTLLASVAAMAAAGCNPNGFSILTTYILHRFQEHAVLYPDIIEERPLWRFLTLSDLSRATPALSVLLLLWALTTLSMTLRWRKLSAARAGLAGTTLLTLLMGLASVRFMVFFLVSAPLLIMRGLGLLRIRARVRRLPGISGPRLFRLGALAAAMGVVAAAVYLGRAGTAVSALVRGGSFRAPALSAANVILRSSLKGNMFNDYGAGGYLVWRLYPSCRVFIYGRVPDPRIYARHRELMSDPLRPADVPGSAGTVPLYRRVFHEHRIDMAVLPACDSETGYVRPLALALGRDGEWAIIHADEWGLVFIRRTPERMRLFTGNTLPPSAVYDQMVVAARAAGLKGGGRGGQIWRASLGYAFYLKGEYKDAIRWLDDCLARVPEDDEVRQLRSRAVRAVVRRP